MCFASYDSRGLLGGLTGGAERQVAILARSFAARGHEVFMVVPGYGGPSRDVDGVRLLGAWDPERGVRLVRAATYRYPALWRLLVGLRADVYYARGRDAFIPLLVAAARRAGGVSMVGVANDRDLAVDGARVPFGLAGTALAGAAAKAEWAYVLHAVLRRADYVVTQHTGQEAACARLGLAHVLLPNIVEAPLAATPEDPDAYGAVWVGNVQSAERQRKGMDELLALAEMLPDVRIAVAGVFKSPPAQDIVRRLGDHANVDVHGALSHAETLQLIASARVVINTSAWEGFSNVMLEGWALGKPAVALTVDPDGLLGSGRLGACAGGDLVAMAADVRRLIDDDAGRREIGERCRAYVDEVHSAAAVCAKYERLLAAPATKAAPA